MVVFIKANDLVEFAEVTIHSFTFNEILTFVCMSVMATRSVEAMIESDSSPKVFFQSPRTASARTYFN